MAKWHCLRSLYGTTVESIHKKWFMNTYSGKCGKRRTFPNKLRSIFGKMKYNGAYDWTTTVRMFCQVISNSYITSQYKKLIYADEDTELWAKSWFCNTSNIVWYLLSNSCQWRYEVKRSAFLIENPLTMSQRTKWFQPKPTDLPNVSRCSGRS